MQLRKFIRLSVAALCTLVAGAAFAVCPPTCSNKVSDSQPGTHKGLQQNLLGGPGLTTLGLLGQHVSGRIQAFDPKIDLTRRDGTTGAAAAPGAPQWSAWTAYSTSNVGYSYAPLSSAGNVNVYLAGADYILNDKVVIGVATAFDHTSVSLNFSGGSLGGSGYTVAPYIGVLINKNMSFDGTIGVGRTNINTAVQGVGGETHSDRILGALGLNYRKVAGDWTFTGRGALSGAQSKVAANTLTDGTSVAGSTTNLSQLRVGAQAAYALGKFTPYASIGYIYDISHPDQTPVNNIPVSNDRDGWLPAVGVRFAFDNMVFGSMQYQSERGRSMVRNDMFLFNVGIRF